MADWRDFDEIDDDDNGVPGPPKRACTGLDHWYKKCGKAVSRRDPESFTQLTTPWNRQINQWTRDHRKIEGVDTARRVLDRARLAFEFLAIRLAETPTGKLLHKRRKTAEVNARYVTKDGKRVYVGKKKTEAKKRRKAEAARAKRECKRATTHGDNAATDDLLWFENQCVAASAEIRRRLRK